MEVVSPKQNKILLGSGSPRRRELVRRIGLEPVVRVSDIPEVRGPDEAPVEYARRLALEKARAVADEVADQADLPRWLLSADTIVVLGEDVLEKPDGPDDACSMLRRLSGERHEVITAFCWLRRAIGEGQERLEEVRHVAASVWLRPLSDAMIERYVATGEPMDKAGSYGIQDIGAVLVRAVEGSYFAVVGLPVCEVVETLQQMGGLEDYPFVLNSSEGGGR